MQKINEVIIVEGIHDIAFLKTFIDAYFIKTDGTSIPDKTIQEIKELKNKGKDFIILTDPDFPGTYIRNKLIEIIPDAYVGFVRKEFAKTDKKVGVEHASQEEILRAISNKISLANSYNNITKSDLIKLGLNGTENASKLRKKVEDYLGIGNSNCKGFLGRISHLDISLDRLKEIIKEVENG